jgi:hypothetical protein
VLRDISTGRGFVRHLLAFALVATFASCAYAQVTPADAELKVDGVTSITVSYDGGPVQASPTFKLQPAKGEYHYDLYLPPGYNDDPKETFPVLFIASPGGNAKTGIWLPRLKSDRFVAVMLIESKNGPWEPIVANFLAAHDDVVKRVRIAPDFKFMTGFSGGARATSICTCLRPGFVGIVLQGAGFQSGEFATFQRNPRLCVYMGFGREDNNRRELEDNIPHIPPQSAFVYTIYDGAHKPFPKDLVDPAFDFLIQWAYYDSPPAKTAMPQYLKIWEKLNAEIESAGSDFEKADAAERAMDYAKSHGLDKDQAAKITELKKKLAELSKAPTHRKETAAREAFKKVASSERAIYRASGGSEPKLNDLMKQAAKAYDSVASKHAGTVYGAKAAEKAKTLSEGLAAAVPKP